MSHVLLALFVAAAPNALGARLAQDAASLLEAPSSAREEASRSCTSFVQWVYGREGISWAPDGGDANTLYRTARRRRALKRSKPLPGDVVFFRETYDRNRNGKLDDGYTHVGI